MYFEKSLKCLKELFNCFCFVCISVFLTFYNFAHAGAGSSKCTQNRVVAPIPLVTVAAPIEIPRCIEAENEERERQLREAENTICQICKDPLAGDIPLLTLRVCQHTFHQICIKEWTRHCVRAKRPPICPTDRRRI